MKEADKMQEKELTTLEQIRAINPAWITDRQGRPFVLFQGLVELAHRKGLTKIQVTVIQMPSEMNNQTTICQSIAEFSDGRVFQDIGDANPGNVGKAIIPHAIRMASTRASARALRLGLNVSGVALEELSDDDFPPSRNTRSAAPDDEMERLHSALVEAATDLYEIHNIDVTIPSDLSLQAGKELLKSLRLKLQSEQRKGPGAVLEAPPPPPQRAPAPSVPNVGGSFAKEEQFTAIRRLREKTGMDPNKPMPRTFAEAAAEIQDLSRQLIPR